MESCLTHMVDKDNILLNSREVAFLLDLSPDTVNEFARRNIIPAFKKGRQWRFRKRDITSVKRQLRGINAAACRDAQNVLSPHWAPGLCPTPRCLQMAQPHESRVYSDLTRFY